MEDSSAKSFFECAFLLILYICINNGMSHHRFDEKKKFLSRYLVDIHSLSQSSIFHERKRKDFLGSMGIQITCCLS